MGMVTDERLLWVFTPSKFKSLEWWDQGRRLQPVLNLALGSCFWCSPGWLWLRKSQDTHPLAALVSPVAPVLAGMVG